MIQKSPLETNFRYSFSFPQCSQNERIDGINFDINIRMESQFHNYSPWRVFATTTSSPQEKE